MFRRRHMHSSECCHYVIYFYSSLNVHVYSLSQIFRSNRPRFCNIVRQKEIHERERPDDTGFGDADYDYYRQHANGPLIARWRKHSQARYFQALLSLSYERILRKPISIHQKKNLKKISL